tara:strand:- start:667 stop:1026 length:360 start_codon:yes stop_codon:yes gene_type:complete
MSQVTNERKIASVKWFNHKAGYGFLTDLESDSDVFVHHNGIQTGDNVYKTLTTGEYVEFSTTQDKTGKTLAVEVTGIRGGKLLCEHPRPVRNSTKNTGGNNRNTRQRSHGGSEEVEASE